MKAAREGSLPSYHGLGPWTAGIPRLVAGVTAVEAGEGAGSISDYGLTSGGAPAVVEQRYVGLARAVGMESAAVGRQVHGVEVRAVDAVPPGRLRVVGDVDGLVTGTTGLLLAVTAADCVPVFIADAQQRGVGLLHAGWRGAAAGILFRGLEALAREYGVEPESVRVHLGPAICGSCYEVGAEVLGAFGLSSDGPARLDLRSELEDQATQAGVSAGSITRSEWCTRCGPVPLHSHRASGASAGRMAAFLGLHPGTRSRPKQMPRELRA